jgi:hypothetical protein
MDVVCRARGKAAEARDGPIYLLTVKTMVQYQIETPPGPAMITNCTLALNYGTVLPIYDHQFLL